MTKEQIVKKHLPKYKMCAEVAYASMDDYAKEVAIEFADWVSEHEFEMLYSTKVWESKSSSRYPHQYTTEQLYNLYLQTLKQ